MSLARFGCSMRRPLWLFLFLSWWTSYVCCDSPISCSSISSWDLQTPRKSEDFSAICCQGQLVLKLWRCWQSRTRAVCGGSAARGPAHDACRVLMRCQDNKSGEFLCQETSSLYSPLEETPGFVLNWSRISCFLWSYQQLFHRLLFRVPPLHSAYGHPGSNSFTVLDFFGRSRVFPILRDPQDPQDLGHDMVMSYDELWLWGWNMSWPWGVQSRLVVCNIEWTLYGFWLQKHSHVAQLSRSNPRLEAMCLLRNVQKEPRQQTQTTGFLCIRLG